MPRASRDFQVFAKPMGALCNLACGYCYYRERVDPRPGRRASRMSADLLERYIAGHLDSHPGPVVRFSWHGGEPTLLGLEGFRTIVELQKKHRPRDVRIFNGIQTNGTLLDDEWGRFLAGEGFSVGLSLDGPRRFHDLFRASSDGRTSFDAAMRGYEVLRRHRVPTDILCVVHARNAGAPLEIYRFFKEIEAPYVSFLPLVEEDQDRPGQAGPESVPAKDWGKFLCAVFDEWVGGDIGRIKVQIFEEAARTAFGQEHSLCLFRPECGDIPVVERDGEVYSCDHFVDAGHRLGNISADSLSALIESPAQRAFGRAKRESLPRACRSCEVLAMCNGECPKNRFLTAPDGEPGLSYLCAGYKTFFRRCRPWVDSVGAEWRRQNRAVEAAGPARPGRNDPCPCGSGRKFKKCCGAG